MSDKLETIVIGIPVDRIKAVEEFLGKKIGRNQTAIIKARVPKKLVKKIRQIIGYK